MNGKTNTGTHWLEYAGIALISIGVFTFLGIRLAIYWLPFITVPIIGCLILIEGMRKKKAGLMISGAAAVLLGTAGFAVLFFANHLSVIHQIGIFLCAGGVVWALITLVTGVALSKPSWWALIPASLFLGTGGVFLFTRLYFVDFVLYLCAGLGLAFIIWGTAGRYLGLIIPGSLLLAAGPGIYAAWGKIGTPNGLMQTGIMLVCFAFGWGLITVLSKVITSRFVWWPLIPGGVFAVVGWGLYIGGDPGSAASFIGNTGSVGLVMVGLYMLLMRRGMRS